MHCPSKLVSHLPTLFSFEIKRDYLNLLFYQLCQLNVSMIFFVYIGKKPRDLLNPKAVKYLQSIFSIKDNIGKKELREISANCGITITQVSFSTSFSAIFKFQFTYG